MSRTPTRPTRSPRPAHATTPTGTALRVRPLPPTEPGAGDVPHTAVTRGVPPPRPGPEQTVPVPARRAAHALVRMALEVVDRHRPPHQTRGAYPPHLVEMLRSLARHGVPGQDLGRARIHRLHINPAGAPPADEDADGPPGEVDYEVCATYARGPRLFALAARIRVTPTTASCTALRLI